MPDIKDLRILSWTSYNSYKFQVWIYPELYPVLKAEMKNYLAYSHYLPIS